MQRGVIWSVGDCHGSPYWSACNRSSVICEEEDAAHSIFTRSHHCSRILEYADLFQFLMSHCIKQIHRAREGALLSFYAVLRGGTNIAATINVSSIYADEARYLSGPEPISLQPCCLYHDILHCWQACSDHELSPLRRVLDESPDHLFRPSF